MKHLKPLFLMLLALQLQAQEGTTVTTDGQTLAYTWLQAPAGGPTAVLIIAGSGPTDRNGNNPMAGTNNSLKQLAEGLAARGISSLRFDKRGIGQSNKPALNEAAMRFDLMIADAAHLVQWIKNQPGIQQVVVMGHSEGSLVAINAALSSEVAGVVSLAGAADPADVILRKQLSNLQEPLKTQAMHALDTLAAGKTLKNYPVFLSSLFRPSVQPYLISWMAHDPCKDAARLTVPALIIGAGRDLQISADDAVKLGQCAPMAAVKTYPELNHLLKPVPDNREANLASYGSETPPVDSQVIQACADFVLRCGSQNEK
jgi:alpha-beta hydrolase superfamily lysophospholipase